MVHRLKTLHAGAIHQYAPQLEYNDYHEGDTDKEIVMGALPVAAPEPIVVLDDEEDPEEVILEDKE
jgi:hypothetical protein